MSTLIAASYAAAQAASGRQDSLGALILAAGEDPTPETLTSAQQAETQSAFAMKVLRKVDEAAQQEGSDLASLMDQEAGIGQHLETYA